MLKARAPITNNKPRPCPAHSPQPRGSSTSITHSLIRLHNLDKGTTNSPLLRRPPHPTSMCTDQEGAGSTLGVGNGCDSLALGLSGASWRPPSGLMVWQSSSASPVNRLSPSPAQIFLCRGSLQESHGHGRSHRHGRSHGHGRSHKQEQSSSDSGGPTFLPGVGQAQGTPYPGDQVCATMLETSATISTAT